MMRIGTPLRLSGAAAVAGGTLRIANTVTWRIFDSHTNALLYLATDALLLLGLIGWYAARARSLGAAGVAGFVSGVAGILVVRSAGLFPGYGYSAGSVLLLAGLVVMTSPIVLRRDGPLTTPLLWAGSLASAVLSVLFAPLAVLAAILFGAGFICAGLGLAKSGS
jgi:hypothetical protein